MKKFLRLKIAEIDLGCQIWVEKNDSGHKNFFKNETRFPGINSRILWLVPFFKGNFFDVISPELEELPDSNFASEMLLWP